MHTSIGSLHPLELRARAPGTLLSPANMRRAVSFHHPRPVYGPRCFWDARRIQNLQPAFGATQTVGEGRQPHPSRTGKIQLRLIAQYLGPSETGAGSLLEHLPHTVVDSPTYPLSLSYRWLAHAASPTNHSVAACAFSIPRLDLDHAMASECPHQDPLHRQSLEQG
jgi:hypothetical protein